MALMMGNEDHKHIYEKTLCVDTFRLLKFRLEPSHSPSNRSIFCSLETFSCQKSPAYSAVSYCWGDAEGSETASQSADAEETCIILKGNRVKIGSNLYSTLLRLSSSSYWWIDALCINQADTAERNAQVSIMHNIYREAERVFVWLGPDENSEAPLIREFFRFLLQKFADDERSKYVEDWFNKDSENDFLAAGLPAIEHPIWKAVIRFWERRWFSRTWVRQEVALAREVEVWCGDTEFTPVELMEVARFNDKSGLGEALLILKSEAPWKSFIGRKIGCNLVGLEALWLWVNGREYFEDEGHEAVATRLTGPISKDKHPLLRIFAMMLYWTFRDEASDSRDKIFASLVLVRQIAASYNVQQLPLQVDYSKTQQDVYRDSTSWVITESGCLGMLCLLQSNIPVQRDQSWVPNYSGSFPMPLCLFNTEPSARVDTLKNTAQLQRLPVLQNSTIAVYAKYCGRVVGVGDTYESMIDRGCFEMCVRLLFDCPLIMSNGKHRLKVWQRTMHGTSARRVSVSCANMSAEFREWLIFFILRKMYRDLVEGRIKSAHDFLNIMPSYVRMAEMDETKTLPDLAFWESTISDIEQISQLLSHRPRFETIDITGRRLFRTSDPVYLGICPESTLPEDELWIVEGSTFPLILRKVHPSSLDSSEAAVYFVVGESYIDDICHVLETLRDRSWLQLVLQ